MLYKKAQSALNFQAKIREKIIAITLVDSIKKGSH